MQKTSGSSLAGRLVRVFLLQALAISLAVVIGVYAAGKVVEGVLVEEALDGEAAHFWSLYAKDPEVPRPNTLNMLGYLQRPAGGDLLPDWLVTVGPGFARIERADGSSPLVHVSQQGDARLYLIFDEIQVSRLAFFFGVAPLSVVLLVIYALTWVGYRLSRSAISPIVRLAARVEKYDPINDDLRSLELELPGSQGAEVTALSGALSKLVGRLRAFVERERDFTRSASHELRTPLAVMRANVDAMQRRAAGQEGLQAPLERMQRTIDDMERLIETLLLLAREDEARLPAEPMLLNDLVAERIEMIRRAAGADAPAIAQRSECLLEVVAPPKVLAIVVDNLLRNAIEHGGKDVIATIGDGLLTISDAGPGMDAADIAAAWEPFHKRRAETRGFGLGLTIVRRICDRFGWPVELDSAPDSGTRVRLRIPGHRRVERRA